MTSDTPPLEETNELVSSEFNVNGVRQNIDALQFEIADKDFKQKFVALSCKQMMWNDEINIIAYFPCFVFIIYRSESPRPRTILSYFGLIPVRLDKTVRDDSMGTKASILILVPYCISN